MEKEPRVQHEVRLWLLRYLSELVWENFLSTTGSSVQCNRKLVCLAEAILEKEDQLDESGRVLQHFVGLIFHVAIIMKHVGEGQLNEEVLKLLNTAASHVEQICIRKDKRAELLKCNLLDVLKSQAVFAFAEKSGDFVAADHLCDRLWPGEQGGAHRALIKSKLTRGLTPTKTPQAIKQDVAALLAGIHSRLPDCLLLELARGVTEAGLSQDSIHKPFSISAEHLVKSYWRRKLKLPVDNEITSNTATNEPQREDTKHAETSSKQMRPDTLSSRLHIMSTRRSSRDKTSAGAFSMGGCDAALEEDDARSHSPCSSRQLTGRHSSKIPLSKKRCRWALEDEERLYVGVQKHGCGKWLVIKHRQGLLHKSTVQIKDKWRNLSENKDRMASLAQKYGPLQSLHQTSTTSPYYNLRHT